MSNLNLQMPEGVTIEENATTYGRFVVQPLERGYGVTIGNAFRRVLLSSLEGMAITAVRIDGVQHEFSTIPGVAEDVADIILNLKGIRFKVKDVKGGTVHLVVRERESWQAGDIVQATPDYEILNPDHHIAALSDDAEIVAELRIEQGRGYVPADDNKRPDDPIGIIPIDAIFTPITNVKYHVSPTRVGDRIDFEKLVIEVETDGSIQPDEAMAQAALILRNHVNLFIQVDTEPEPVAQKKEVDEKVQRIRNLLLQSVDELELSVRAHNCLKAANIKTIGDLVRREENEMLKFRNFGRKSLNELIQVLEERNLGFGMDVNKYLEDVA